MNEAYKKLKKEYDEIDEEILELHQKQGELRDLMELECTHEDPSEVEPDPFSYDDEKKYKCQYCYRYFKESELKAMGIKVTE